MNNECTPITNSGSLGLHLMVNRISASSLPAATRKHSFIVNEVPADLEVCADEQMLATVFGSLLNTLINYTEHSCIRISAKLYGKVVLMNIKENQQLNRSAFAGSLRQVQQLAEKIGGSISISSDRSKATTVILSFSNQIAA
jgi:signal transduction histidine kinase